MHSPIPDYTAPVVIQVDQGAIAAVFRAEEGTPSGRVEPDAGPPEAKARVSPMSPSHHRLKHFPDPNRPSLDVMRHLHRSEMWDARKSR